VSKETARGPATFLRAIYRGRAFDAFLSSAAVLFPNPIVSSEGAAYSLTVSRAASGEKTLEVIVIVAALGMPFVLAYTGAVYWVFRGKVKMHPTSY
jgi:cytochrome d ubiquinol oxidase subunit II